MEYFAGLDVSLEETAICIVDDAGRIVRAARAASEPEALVAFFRASGMVMKRVGLEACSLTAWLHQGLTAAGIAAICIEARQAKAAMGAMPNKTDRNDTLGCRRQVAVDGGENPRLFGGGEKVGTNFAVELLAAKSRGERPLPTPIAAEGGGRRPAFTGGWRPATIFRSVRCNSEFRTLLV